MRFPIHFILVCIRWYVAYPWSYRHLEAKGAGKCLYRFVDKEGKTVDFLLTAKRDKGTALRYFDKAMKASGVPKKVTIDKSGANKAAMDEVNARCETPVIIQQVKYLNNIVEQDLRTIKRATKSMLNFKSFQIISNHFEPSEMS